MHIETAPPARSTIALLRDEAPTPMFLEDEASRTAFVDAHYERLFRWLWWQTGSSETAADLTQDAFAAFWSSRERVHVHEPRLWLYRIARNRWRKWCRDGRPMRSVGLDERVTDLAGPAEDAARTDLARRAVAGVEALPSHYREAVTLRYWGDLSYREIGRVLGVTTALARWRVFQAQRLLRESIGDVSSSEGGAS